MKKDDVARNIILQLDLYETGQIKRSDFISRLGVMIIDGVKD